MRRQMRRPAPVATPNLRQDGMHAGGVGVARGGDYRRGRGRGSSSSKDKIKNANDGGKAAFLGGGGYDEQCVGRSARPQLDVYKIPPAAAAAVATPETWGPDFFPASAVGAMFDGVS